MALRTLSAKNAAALDKELMSSGAFSIDQLMELAGLSVAQTVYRVHTPTQGKSILVACGPGNNGGDGLVAARHLHHFGYAPIVYYPKQPQNELYARLRTQLEQLDVPFTTDFEGSLKTADHVIDAVFGFSFNGPLRDPFPSVINLLSSTSVPVLSVDAPSSWDIETGPPAQGPGCNFMPQALISLTAPKPCVKYFHGRHFLGGRFLGKKVAEMFDIDVPPYERDQQIIEVGDNDTSGGKL